MRNHGLTFRRLLVGAVVVLSFLGLFPGPAHAVDPDYCKGSGGSGALSCTGRDPQSFGCWSGAVNKLSGQAANGVIVELRYSKLCHAYWARYRNQYGAAGTARVYGGSTMQAKTLAAYKGEEGWTKMVSGNLTNFRACILFNHKWQGWVEYCPR